MLNDALKEEIQTAYTALLDQQNFRPRQCQKNMIAEIARTLGSVNEEPNKICVIEAGTGTGKTIAYALAAIPIAKHLKKKIVLATATVALQEQIVFQDFPSIKQYSGLDFSFAMAKGRRRYLCLSRLDLALQDSGVTSKSLTLFGESTTDDDFGYIYQDMIDQLSRGNWDGDRDNWPDEIDPLAWSRVSTDHAQCTQRQCSHYDNCYFYRARESIHRADCIVTNQDLVLADLMMGGGAVLPVPEETIYIFDECHHLPDKAGNHFSYSLALYATRGWLLQLPTLLDMVMEDIASPNGERFAALPDKVDEAVRSLDIVAKELMLLRDDADITDDGWRWRFEHGRVPDQLGQTAVSLAIAIRRLVELFESIEPTIENTLENRSGLERETAEQWLAVVSATSDRLRAAAALLENYAASEHDPPYARWIRFLSAVQREGMEIQLNSHPVSVAKEMSKRLWERCAGAVLTSATISVGGDFSVYQAKTGIDADQSFISLPSPFRFQEQATLVIPPMDNDPSNAELHTLELAAIIPRRLVDEQSAMVLFTSWRQMLRVYEDLDEKFQRRVLKQGDLAKQEILKRHRELVDDGGTSCIFGLASFAEGVDLPGNYCRHVIIAKLPFSVPDDPVEATLSEWIESRGGNPFYDLMLPNAALRVIQAAGRLLRTETDSGTVTILDRRLLTKSYGKVILNALPPFRREFH